MRKLLQAAALLFLVAAPAALAETTFNYGMLGDTQWTASEWNGAAPKPKMVPLIVFASQNRFTASAGCNLHSGGYTVQGERIAFDPKTSTKMACQGERGQTDQRLVADLKRIVQLKLETNQLVAYAADGAKVMSLRCTKNC